MTSFLPVPKLQPRHQPCFLLLTGSSETSLTSLPSLLPQETRQSQEAPYPDKVFLHVVMDQINPGPFLSMVQAFQGHL